MCNNWGGNSCLWIILILLLCGGCGNNAIGGCSSNGCGNGCGCCDNGCGCSNNCCC